MNSWSRNIAPVVALLLLVNPAAAQAHWPVHGGILHGLEHLVQGVGTVILLAATGALAFEMARRARRTRN